MKAVIAERYGPPEVLKIVDIEKPVPKANEVLVKIKTSAVNAADVRTRGLIVPSLIIKLIMRLAVGITKPRKPMGVVFAGVVESIGSDVKLFKPGDEVYASSGFKFGGNAEYIAMGENKPIAFKPKKASFEQAAAIPFGGTTAIYFLDKAGIQTSKGRKVLIYGASGAVGTAGVMVAKHYGAEVTAVCGEDGVALTKSIGADHVIVYTKDDFTKNGHKYDIIFDAVGKKPKKECAGSLSEGGKYVSTGSLDVASENKDQLKLLAELFDAGKYKAVIDRTYAMEDIVEAHRYVDSGKKKGNVVIVVSK